MRVASAKYAARWCVALTLVALLGLGGPSAAQVPWPDRANEPGKTFPGEVVVTARRLFTDEQMTEHVEKALADDPYVYAEHVTVTTSKGVVTCEGIVADEAELQRVLRICRRASGSKRVVSELQINDYPPEGG